MAPYVNVDHSEIVGQAVPDEYHTTVHHVQQLEIHSLQCRQMLRRRRWVQIPRFDATELGQVIVYLQLVGLKKVVV
jgi:hypothetical protein